LPIINFKEALGNERIKRERTKDEAMEGNFCSNASLLSNSISLDLSSEGGRVVKSLPPPLRGH